MWYRSNREGYICGSYARQGKKAYSNHLIREKLLNETILTDIQKLVKQMDKQQCLKKLEAQSKKSKQNIEKQLEKLEKQFEIIKRRKRKYINMLAEEIITQEEYRENVEANNIEFNELAENKNDLLTAMESEQTADNIEKFKQELLQFLNFDELTPEINRIEVKEDGTPFIHYRFSASIPD
ncbi:hypothetical protein [Neobacillus niacini]|jgi:site-specific DNA recombinase|uniref:hypothetical protein n=1 Tax=Neobacillus niacini TaxID=86668 RepID=UPI001C8F1B87|nr:hypothetical protein [Neobacillus niacini]MBY0148604.1 hypothetical protein [Neobacillus niacini]